MKTQIIKLSEDNIDVEAIKKAGDIIKSGGIVAFPTETVYGLGGNAYDKDAASKIYAAKGRPSDNPLIVHIADIADLDKLTIFVPKKAKILADNLWPGPLTMIFTKLPDMPYETTGGLETIAVRFPSNKIAQALIKASGGFVAAPSANRSGRPSTTKASHVIEDMNGRIDMIIDGGESKIGLESTIIDFSVAPPTLLRPGFYDTDKIESLIGRLAVDPAVYGKNGERPPKAPGMKYRHYAPHAELYIVEGNLSNVIKKINELVSSYEASGKKTAVLCIEENKDRYSCNNIFSLGSGYSEETIAHRLFDVLRENDELGVEVIFSEGFYTPMLGRAIMNRLNKAAGFNTIKV